MPIIDPHKTKRPAPRVETRTFTDDEFPGVSWPLTIRVLNEAPFQLSVQARADELIRDFVLPEDAPAGKMEPREKVAPVEDEDGNLRDIKLDELTCQRIAAIQCTELPQEGESPLDVDTLAKYAVVYNVLFLQAAAWVFTALNAPRKTPQGAPLASGEPDMDGPFGQAATEPASVSA